MVKYCTCPHLLHATSAVVLHLPGLGRAGELSSAWRGDVSGGEQQNCAKLRPFVSFQE